VRDVGDRLSLRTRYKEENGIMKNINFMLLIAIMFFISGCWIALPSDGPADAKKYIGQSYILQRDILIVSYWLTPISWETSKGNSIGRGQEVLDTLKAGSEIKVISVKSFRLPSGVHHAYRCIDVKSGRKFDLSFRMRDCIGLPLSKIHAPKNEGKKFPLHLSGTTRREEIKDVL
jgi:hypothetical protein